MQKFLFYLYCYSQPQQELPSPRGDLSLSLNSKSIALVNKEVLEATKSSGISGKHGHYKKLDDDLWAEIHVGKYACYHGVAVTSRYMKPSTCYGLNTFQWEKNCCRNIFMGEFCSRKCFNTKIKTSKIFAIEIFRRLRCSFIC